MTPTQLRITLTEDELARWNVLRELACWPRLKMPEAMEKINSGTVGAQTALLARIRV